MPLLAGGAAFLQAALRRRRGKALLLAGPRLAPAPGRKRKGKWPGTGLSANPVIPRHRTGARPAGSGPAAPVLRGRRRKGISFRTGLVAPVSVPPPSAAGGYNG